MLHLILLLHLFMVRISTALLLTSCVLHFLVFPVRVFSQADASISEMPIQVLLERIQSEGIAATLPLAIDFLKRLEEHKNPSVEVELMRSRLYFELSRSFFNRFAEGGAVGDLESSIEYGRKLRKHFPEAANAVNTLQFEIDGKLSQREWDGALEALKEGLQNIDSGLYFESYRSQWLSQICFVYSLLEEWENGEPYFALLYNSLDSSKLDRALAAIYLIRAYEALETPLKALLYVSAIGDAGDERWDPHLNLSLFKLGNQLSDEAEYTKANYLYFLSLTLEEITQFNQQKLAVLEDRLIKSRSLIEDEDALEGLMFEKQSLERYIASLKEQTSYTAPLKYARARNLKRMGRNFDSFFAFLRLIREHPDHSYVERYHYTAFNQSVEIRYHDYSVQLGEEYLGNSVYEAYWREVTVKLMSVLFEQEEYDRVIALGKTFMERDPEHPYGINVVHFMSSSWMRVDDIESLREQVGQYVASYPQAPLNESANYWLGLANVVEQKFESAKLNFDRVIEDYANGSFYIESRFRRAVCEFGLGNYVDAKELFKEWVLNYPNHELRGEAEGLLGDIYAFESDVDTALAHYEAVDQYTNRMNLIDHAYFESVRLLEANNRFQEMVDRLEQYSKRYPETGNLARAIFRIGQAYENLGQPEVMLESYFLAIIRFGNNPKAEGVDQIFVRFSEKYYKFRDNYESTLAFLNRLMEDEEFRIEMLTDRKAMHVYRMQNPSIDRDVMDTLLRDEALRYGLSPRPLPQTEEQIAAGEALNFDKSMLPEAKRYLEDKLAITQERIEKYPSVTPEERFKDLFELSLRDGRRTLQMRLLVAFDALGIPLPEGVTFAYDDLDAASPATLGWIARKEIENQPHVAIRAAKRLMEDYPNSLAYPDGLFALAELSAKEGKVDAALELYDSIQDNYPMWPEASTTAVRAADILFESEDVQGALDRYLAILNVRDWRGEVWAEACLKIGRCFEKMGEPMKAHGFYERTYLSYRTYPKWTAKALYFDALLLESMNEAESARNLYGEYLELPRAEELTHYEQVKRLYN